jgi:hypothetical protein
MFFLNNNNINNYIQFCLNYQTQFNNMLLTQHQMHNNIFNLINTSRYNTYNDRNNPNNPNNPNNNNPNNPNNPNNNNPNNPNNPNNNNPNNPNNNNPNNPNNNNPNNPNNNNPNNPNNNNPNNNNPNNPNNPNNNNPNNNNPNINNRINRNIPFERTRIFTIPLTNDIGNFTRTMNDNVRDIINELFTDINSNSSILTQQQIENACEIIKFQDISTDQDCCPISLVIFQQNDDVMRIKYCNHIFLPENLRRWFSQSSKCPLCRFDIRHYSTNDTSNNDISMNNTSNNTIHTLTNENTNTIPSLTTPNNSTYLTTLQMLNGLNDIMRHI